MESQRETVVGKVISTSMDKTIVVQTETYKKHPLYKKRVKYTKKYKAHDEENKAKVGDTVKILACRPLSKTKRFVLDSIVEEAIIL
jgi:small subunit ribosomal protein S17